MKTEEAKSILRAAIAKYGISHQVDMAHEEMGELVVALHHLKRGKATADDVITEIADVTIMIYQLAEMFGVEKVQAEIDRKLKRLSERMNSEMNESEDERMRKAALEGIEYLERDCGWDVIGDIDILDVKEYLEKQKMQPTNEEMLRTLRAEYEKGVADTIAKYEQKEQKLTESISRLTVQGKGVYKICPRCKERMVRDDSKVYTSMPPQYGYNCPKCGTMEFDTVMYDNPEMEEQKLEEWSEDIIRKAVKEVGLTQHQIDWFKTNVFPPMQEWSEEDREMLNSVLLYFNAPFHDMTDGELKAFNWLKSLPERFILQPKQEWSEKDERKYQCIRSILLTDVDKKVGSWKYSEILEWYEKRGIGRYTNSQPHWKPSEEQIGALNYAYCELFKRKDVGDNILGSLQKLIDQLREQM